MTHTLSIPAADNQVGALEGLTLRTRRDTIATISGGTTGRWSPAPAYSPAPAPPRAASRAPREFWKIPAGAAVVIGVAFSVLLTSVAFGVQAKIDSLVAHPHLRVPSNLVPVHRIHEILLYLTVVVAGAMLLQTAISTYTMGSALMRSRRDEIAIRRQNGVLRSRLLAEFCRAMLIPCLTGGAIGEILGVIAGLVLRSSTVLPIRFTLVSTLSAFPTTILLAVLATLIPAWASANASPALLRKE